MKICSKLYKVNQISIAKFKFNLGIRLTNEHINLSDIPDVPTDGDVLKVLTPDGDTSSTDIEDMNVHNSCT